jgi:hypothetical protein
MTTGHGAREPRDAGFGKRAGAFRHFYSTRVGAMVAELNVHLINQTDVLRAALPEHLWALYPLLRMPLWLWRHAARHRP